MNPILEKIIKHKEKEVQCKQKLTPEHYLRESPLLQRPLQSLKERFVQQKFGIIAEHKRRSPSQPMIHFETPLHEIIQHYTHHEVAGISVLTDNHFFGGSLEDLLQSRTITEIPLLRKDFIIHPYQIIEAKAHGADVILLIAVVLQEKQLIDFTQFAHSLQMEVLIEIHSETELEKTIPANPDFIGVNNRNLNTFETSLKTSEDLSQLIPNSFIKISESGIKTIEDLEFLKTIGFNGLLIGETFMRDFPTNTQLNQFSKFLNK